MSAVLNSGARRVGLLGLLGCLLVAGCFEWQGTHREREQNDAAVNAPDGNLPRPPGARPDSNASAVPSGSTPSPVPPSLADAAVAPADAATTLATCVVGAARLGGCRLR